MSRSLDIETAPVFEPLLDPARYKGAWGGRGSGKSYFFADLLIERCLLHPGTRWLCVREVQKSLMQSAKRLIETELTRLGLGEVDGFRVQNERIITPGDGVIVFQGMQDHTADTLKSYEGFDGCWVEEAQSLSELSLTLLRPTIRKEGSELWFSWNPRRKVDPVDAMLRGESLPTGAVVVKANWSDNPWFPGVLEQERLDCLKADPDGYDHIWEGGYVTVAKGAYYAEHLAAAKRDGRIGNVGPDPLMEYRAFVDIGGSGAKADAFAMWVCQWVGREVRVLDWYEAVGQDPKHHFEWLRDRGYEKARIYLPHDGDAKRGVDDTTWAGTFRKAGYKVETVPNQGKGAAGIRIKETRKLFPSIWFNEATTEGGRAALGWYHEKMHPELGVGLGPEHDWCFTGDTLVWTRYGMCPIMELDQQGEVLTPWGWKPYVNPRVTGRNARLVEVRFANGSSVRCTPEHLFMTANGWKSAEHLRRGSLILSTSTNLRSTSTVDCIERGRERRTCRAAGKSYTETCGSQPLGQSRTDATFTTRITIRSTTALKTLSAFRNPSTYLRRPKTMASVDVGSRLAHMSARRNGTNPRRDDCGTSDTPNGRNRGRSGSARRSLASTAARRWTRWCERAGTARNTVPAFARPLRIESVTRVAEREDVWDITVPSVHCFTLANGAVVHNSSHSSDAFGLMCCCYEPPQGTKPTPPPRYSEGEDYSTGTGY